MITVRGLKQEDCIPMSNGIGIYLHGTLEEENGFDLCNIEEPLSKDGTYMVDCILANGNVRRSNLYFWTIKYGDETQLRGLVCDCNDKEANEYAREMLDERSVFL